MGIIGDCVENASDHISAAAMSQIGAGIGNFGTLALMKFMMDDLELKGAANYVGSIFYLIALFALIIMMFFQRKTKMIVSAPQRQSIITITNDLVDENKPLVVTSSSESKNDDIKILVE